MRYSLAAADVCDCHYAGTDADDFIAATIVGAVRNDQGVMVCSDACFDAHPGDDVGSRVILRKVIVHWGDVHHAASAVLVRSRRCRRSGRWAERAKIAGQCHHGDGDSDCDKC